MMKILRSGAVIFLLSIILTFLTACGFLSPKQENQQDLEEQQSEVEEISSTISIVKMDLSKVMTRAVGDYYVVHVDLTNEDHPIKHELIESTEVSLRLDKGHVYVVGIFKHTDEGIVPIGLVGDEKTGLSSLPITSDATDVIDLGTLEASNGILSTTISPEKFANMLGFADEEAIKQFGGYDITLKNLLNPDINQNGVFDDEEGIKCYIEPNYDFTVWDKNYYDNPDSPEKYYSGLGLCIWIKQKGYYFDYAVYKDTGYATLVLPNDQILSAFHSGGNKEEGGDMFCFDFKKEVPLLSGRYTLILHDLNTKKDISYHFFWNFLDPYNQYGGFLFPLQKVIATSDGICEKLLIKWKLFDPNGEIKEISNDVVKLLSRRYKLYNWEMVAGIPKLVFNYADLKAYEDHLEYDLSDVNQIYRWQVRTQQMELARFEFQDIANNVINIRAPIYHEKLPYNLKNLTSWSETSAASLTGIWYNHSFIRDDNHYTVLVFQPDGTLEVFTTWEGILWSRLNPTKIFSYTLDGSNLTITDEEGSSTSFTIKEAEASDGRRFIKLECDDGTLIYTNFYSYINAYGKILEDNGHEYLKLKSVTIDSFEDNTLTWSIDWDGEYDSGVVGFDFYIGTSEGDLKLAYFQYEDYEHMQDKKFQVNLKDLLNLTPGIYYVKIVANTWKETKESSTIMVEVK